MKRTKLRASQRALAMFLRAVQLLAASECACDDATFPNLADIGEDGLELITHPGKVCINSLGLDVVGHEDGEEAERVGSRGDGHVVQTTELEVGIGGGGV